MQVSRLLGSYAGGPSSSSTGLEEPPADDGRDEAVLESDGFGTGAGLLRYLARISSDVSAGKKTGFYLWKTRTKSNVEHCKMLTY